MFNFLKVSLIKVRNIKNLEVNYFKIKILRIVAQNWRTGY